MPLMLTNNGKFWMGAAAKFGPVLFGLHNLGYLFSKNSIHQGGGYLALTLRPSDFTKKNHDRSLECPEDRKTILQKLGLK